MRRFHQAFKKPMECVSKCLQAALLQMKAYAQLSLADSKQGLKLVAQEAYKKPWPMASLADGTWKMSYPA